MKKGFIILIATIILFCGCSDESIAKKMYLHAQDLENNHSYTQAIEKYETIANKYPRTTVGSSIQKDIQRAKAEQLQYYISQNKPKIISAVRNYPFPLAIDGGKEREQVILFAAKLGIPVKEETRVDRELKISEIGACILLYQSNVRMLSNCLLKTQEPYIWDAESTDNMNWTVTMKKGGASKQHTSVMKIDMQNQILTLTRREDCGGFAPHVEEWLAKSKRKVNWKKECVVPIELEGVLK